MELLAVIIFLLIVVGALAARQSQETKANNRSLREELVAKYGDATKIIEDFGLGNETVYVFETPRIIVINGEEYGFDSLLDFTVNGSQSYKVSTSTGSALGRGIVGGVLFGGVGALAGAGTASKKVNPDGSDYLICITTKELANPMIEYRTNSDKRANELVSVLTIILGKQKNS